MASLIGGGAGGLALALLLLVGRWFPRGTIVALLLIGSVAWFLAGVQMLWISEMVLPRSILVALMERPYFNDNSFTYGHAFLAGCISAGISLVTARFVWRWNEHRYCLDEEPDDSLSQC